MRFISTLSEKFSALLDSHIDRAVTRVILRDKAMLAEQVAESFRHLIDQSCTPEQVAEHIDAAAVARSVNVGEIAYEIDMDDVAERVAERVDVDTSEIASNVARQLDTDDLVDRLKDAIDTDDVIEKAAENLSIDTDAVIEKAAELVADDIDRDDIAVKVAENIDWEADVLDYEELAKAMLRCFAKSIVKS